jgi:predicted kinase
MPLWNIVLTGYPGSGKTVLARRLVSDIPNFVRINVDDLRQMYFGSTEPTVDEDFVYGALAALRDHALRNGRSVILDCTAPTNLTRDFLLKTNVANVIRLVLLVTVEKTELERRNRERGTEGLTKVWDAVWEKPATHIPAMQFRNNSLAEFETSYYVLTELLRSQVHPFKHRFLIHHRIANHEVTPIVPDLGGWG